MKVKLHAYFPPHPPLNLICPLNKQTGEPLALRPLCCGIIAKTLCCTPFPSMAKEHRKPRLRVPQLYPVKTLVHCLPELGPSIFPQNMHDLTREPITEPVLITKYYRHRYSPQDVGC